MAEVEKRCLFRGSCVRRLGLVMLLAMSLVPLSAKSEPIEIDGCEAADIFALLAPGGQGRWQAPEMRLGDWSFAHAANLDCKGSSCRVNAELWSRVGGQEGIMPLTGTASEAVPGSTSEGRINLLDRGRVGRSVKVLQGHPAMAMAEAIGGRSFRDPMGRDHFVWVDFGRLNRSIALRGRTEIVCKPGGESCSIGTSTLVYVEYDERQRCGDFSKDRELTGRRVAPAEAIAADLGRVTASISNSRPAAVPSR